MEKLEQLAHKQMCNEKEFFVCGPSKITCTYREVKKDNVNVRECVRGAGETRQEMGMCVCVHVSMYKCVRARVYKKTMKKGRFQFFDEESTYVGEVDENG